MTNMQIFSENEQLENVEGKLVTNAGYSAVEDSPLLTSKETLITLDYVNTLLQSQKIISKLQGTCSPVSPAKKDINNKDIKDANSVNDDSDDDEESMDWWTKYFASLDKMIMVSDSLYLTISNGQGV